MVQYERSLWMSNLEFTSRPEFIVDVPFWSFPDHTRDVRAKCMYTNGKIRICLVGMKVLRKQIRLFSYSGKLE